MADPDPKTIPLGTYRHNKTGNLYEVVGVALHSETNEFLVIYKALYQTKYELFARPYDMFTQDVDLDGVKRPRFEKVSDDRLEEGVK
jgi:hypothetical protein